MFYVILDIESPIRLDGRALHYIVSHVLKLVGVKARSTLILWMHTF